MLLSARAESNQRRAKGGPPPSAALQAQRAALAARSRRPPLGTPHYGGRPPVEVERAYRRASSGPVRASAPLPLTVRELVRVRLVDRRLSVPPHGPGGTSVRRPAGTEHGRKRGGAAKVQWSTAKPERENSRSGFGKQGSVLFNAPGRAFCCRTPSWGSDTASPRRHCARPCRSTCPCTACGPS